MSRVALREAVSGCLEAVLTAASEIGRRAAEQEMKALEVTEGEHGLNRLIVTSLFQNMELCWLS